MKQCNLVTAGLLVIGLALPLNLSAQKASKVSQSIKVNDEVTVDINTSFCNIELDTWNKDIVEIEAYIDGEKLSQEELEKALKQWHVDVDATSSNVVISTNRNFDYNWDFRFSDSDAVVAAMDELKFQLADIPEIHIQIPDMEFLIPEISSIDLPPLPEGISQIHFDYQAYQRDGEKYMEKWSEEFEKKFGKEYEKEMEVWAEKFSKEWEEKYGKEWEEKFSKRMEEWGERFGKQMEEWGKRYEEQMAQREKMQAERAKLQEERAKQREEMMEAREVSRKVADEQRARAAEVRRAKIGTMIDSESNLKVNRVIKIKVPKKAKLKLNVEHGELILANNVSNMKADLIHTKLTANSINGSNTSINVSYAPVVINNWDVGKLNLNYVDSAKLTSVKHLVLNSNSSNVLIDKVDAKAIVDGSFGELKILNVDPNFSDLNLILQNSDVILVLPKTDFNLQFNGNQTFLKHPKNSKKELVKQFSLGSMTNPKTIVVNAKFSDVKLQ